jgi:hypothetical protein
VIPTDRDDLENGTIQDEIDTVPSPERITSLDMSYVVGTRQRASTFDSYQSFQSTNSQQHGALFRRVCGTNAAPPPLPPPSRFVDSPAFSSTLNRSGTTNSISVSFHNPPADNDSDRIVSIGRDSREEKSV